MAVLLIAFFFHAARAVLRGPAIHQPAAPAEVQPGIYSALAKSPAQ
jgi:hypothetical protein